MIKKFESRRLSLKAKIIIFLAVLLGILIGLDYFFDTYTFVFPIKKLEFQWIIQRREFKPQKSSVEPIKIKRNSPLAISPLENEKKPATSDSTRGLASKFGLKTVLNDRLDSYEAIYVYFGKDKVAYAIAMAESRMNCKTISKTDDHGLFQINKVHLWRFEKFGGDPFNCWDNAKVAYEIYKEQGWRPWSAYNNKSYLAFLD